MASANDPSRHSMFSNPLLSRISFLSVGFILSAIVFSFLLPHPVMLMALRALLNIHTHSLLECLTPPSE